MIMANTLIKTDSLNPYGKKERRILGECKTPEIVMRQFFEFMAAKGWDLYVKTDYLRNVIESYSVKMKNLLKEEDSKIVVDRDYKIMPKLTGNELELIRHKWKGNLMEIIAEEMFKQKCHPFRNKYDFCEWTGQDVNDSGVDGWCRHTANKRFYIGIQVKYRFNTDVKWNDQITKALALTDQKVKDLYRANKLTDKEWCRWGKDIVRRAILVTTTKVSDSITNNIGINAFDKIDEDDLLEYLGKAKGINGNHEFWLNVCKSL
jgi:hypothetical protein